MNISAISKVGANAVTSIAQNSKKLLNITMPVEKIEIPSGHKLQKAWLSSNCTKIGHQAPTTDTVELSVSLQKAVQDAQLSDIEKLVINDEFNTQFPIFSKNAKLPESADEYSNILTDALDKIRYAMQ